MIFIHLCIAVPQFCLISDLVLWLLGIVLNTLEDTALFVRFVMNYIDPREYGHDRVKEKQANRATVNINVCMAVKV